MLHFLLDDSLENASYPKDAIHIQDGNALFHALTNLPPTFGRIALQILDQMVSKKNFIFSTDSYHPDSIKAQERLRRGCSEKLILEGVATRTPPDFKVFLCNEENKLQLCSERKNICDMICRSSKELCIGTYDDRFKSDPF